MQSSIFVFQPVATRQDKPQQLGRALDNLAGKVIGFIDNSKPNFDLLADNLSELLVQEYGVAKILRHRKSSPAVSASKEMKKELFEQCDAVITGSGD